MRKLAGLTVVTFAALAVAGASGSTPLEIGTSNPTATVVIEKTLPAEYDAPLPPSWRFQVDSLTCGPLAIFGPGGQVGSVIVEVPAAGGTSAPFGVFGSPEQQPGIVDGCDYRVRELPVDGWEPVSPAGGVVQITPPPSVTTTVTFANRPVPPPEVTTTTTIETTTTVAETTTTAAETTTTATDTTTTAAPTTAPPTTAGTVARELPATGSSNALTGLLAGLLVLSGLGAVAVSRRT